MPHSSPPHTQATQIITAYYFVGMDMVMVGQYTYYKLKREVKHRRRMCCCCERVLCMCMCVCVYTCRCVCASVRACVWVGASRCAWGVRVVCTCVSLWAQAWGRASLSGRAAVCVRVWVYTCARVRARAASVPRLLVRLHLPQILTHTLTRATHILHYTYFLWLGRLFNLCVLRVGSGGVRFDFGRACPAGGDRANRELQHGEVPADNRARLQGVCLSERVKGERGEGRGGTCVCVGGGGPFLII